jgi:eukaryotic-like serine/threonine-protein kinase
MAPISAVAPVERARRPTLAFGPFVFDPNGQVLRRGADELPLPPRVLGVLELLLDRAGDLVSRQELTDAVWKDAFVTDTSLAEAVSVLRQALGDDPQAPTYVQTVHRRGYRFVAPVDVRTPDARPTPKREEVGTNADTPVSPSIGAELVPWSIAVICLALAGGAVWQMTHAPDATAPVGRFGIAVPAGTVIDPSAPALAISPDGSHIAWAGCAGGKCRVYLRALDRLDPVTIDGSDGAASPFFSADGRFVAFFAEGKLKKAAITGGAPSALADVAEPRGGAWLPDGRIVFGASRAAGLMQIAENGGPVQPFTTPSQAHGDVRHAWPSLAADGRTLLFSIATVLDSAAPARLGAATVASRGGPARWTESLGDIGRARAAAPDLCVFSKGRELYAAGFDPVRLAVTGVPRAAVPAVNATPQGADFTVSAAGSLLFAAAQPDSGPPHLAWMGDARAVPLAEGATDAERAALSPDGRRLAWTRPSDAARADIWVGDLERGAVTRLTHDGVNDSPIWSPDGRTIYFARRTTGTFRVASVSADGGPSSDVAHQDSHFFPASIAPDASRLAAVRFTPATRGDIWSIPLHGGAVQPILAGPFDEVEPAFSPDGALLAYQSDEAGRWDVYVQRLNDNRRIVVSTTGGAHPFWSPDGRGLYFTSEGRLLRAPIYDGGQTGVRRGSDEGQTGVRRGSDPSTRDLHVGPPQAVSEITDGRVVGVAPDGRVLVQQRPPLAPTTMVLVTDWVREARALLGPPTAPVLR